MRFYRDWVRPLLFRCDPEWVHDIGIRVCEWTGPAAALLPRFRRADPRLATEVAGIRFEDPVGLAAGYDKSGRALRMLAAMGFGFLEIGSVSAEPSAGNPRPRLWRLPEDEAICVHYGLPNDGAERVARRLAGRPRTVPLGINLAPTNRGPNAPPDSAETILADYAKSAALLAPHADYLCLNLSCPNTEQGGDFFAAPGRIGELLGRLEAGRVGCPVFLKVSPAGGDAALERLLAEVEPHRRVAGFAFNLPAGKPSNLRSPRSTWENLPGAVAGKPQRDFLLGRVGALYRRMDRTRYRIIASGGIASGEDAYAYLRHGASLVQVFTALVYEGPFLLGRIRRTLSDLLARDGFASVAAAVGTAHRGQPEQLRPDFET